MLKRPHQKTTIWRLNGTVDTLVSTVDGFPFGTPAMGGEVMVPGLGAAKCIGISTSGSGANEQVVEVKLRVA